MRKESAELSAVRLRMSRRVFLARAGKAALAVASLSALDACSLAGPGGRSRDSSPLFSDEQRATIAAVQDHMLPSTPGSPGASDLNALGYLEAALLGSDVEPTDTGRIREGAADLAARSLSRHGRPFDGLAPAERESLLREMEDGGEGEIFLTLVMGYLIEAWVGDPAYGGNPDGVAWAWLEHKPGYPRPPLVSPGDRR